MIRNFISGITSYSKALELISKLKLWKYVLLPGILSLVLGGIILSTAWGLSDDIGGILSGFYPFEIGKGIIESVATVFGGVLVLAFGLILFKHLILIISGPFMSPLSEAVESHLRGQDVSPKFSLGKMTRDIWRGVRIAVRNATREIFYTLLLLILGLFPLFAPFTTIAIFLVQAYYFGFGNMDFALERHFGVKDSIRFVRRNKGLALGNGTVTMILMMTVVGFIFILPLGTVAATTETVKRMQKAKVLSDYV